MPFALPSRALLGHHRLDEAREPHRGGPGILAIGEHEVELHEALAAFLTVLDRYTLADLVARRRKPLTRLLEAS